MAAFQAKQSSGQKAEQICIVTVNNEMRKWLNMGGREREKEIGENSEAREVRRGVSVGSCRQDGGGRSGQPSDGSCSLFPIHYSPPTQVFVASYMLCSPWQALGTRMIFLRSFLAAGFLVGVPCLCSLRKSGGLWD